MKSLVEFIKEGKEKTVTWDGGKFTEYSYCKTWLKKKDVKLELKNAAKEANLEKVDYLVIDYDKESGKPEDRRIVIYCKPADEDKMNKILDIAAKNYAKDPGPSRSNIYKNVEGYKQGEYYKIIMFCE